MLGQQAETKTGEHIQSKRLENLANLAINEHGWTHTQDSLQTPLEEVVNGKVRNVKGVSIDDGDGAITYAFRTLEEDYLAVEIVVQEQYRNRTKPVLEVSNGQVTFNPKDASYAIAELNAIMRGETTEGRRKFIESFDFQESSIVAVLPFSDTEYASLLTADGNEKFNYQLVLNKIQEFRFNPCEAQQFESLLRIAETIPEVLTADELKQAKHLQQFSHEVIDKINSYLEVSVFHTRLEIF